MPNGISIFVAAISPVPPSSPWSRCWAPLLCGRPVWPPWDQRPTHHVLGRNGARVQASATMVPLPRPVHPDRPGLCVERAPVGTTPTSSAGTTVTSAIFLGGWVLATIAGLFFGSFISPTAGTWATHLP
ncbi:MAG: hypothetical protein R2710_25385 [Acidimicrobiales bacterium]